jgi:chemotaxis protein methyltransferase CheR
MTLAVMMPPSALERLSELVETRAGLHFAGSRRTELTSKAARAFVQSGCATWETYLAHLCTTGGRPLFEQLIEALTVGETYFFRHRPYFEVLEREVLPELIAKRRATRQLRLWCAGCATGEEAYSLAILCGGCCPIWKIGRLASWPPT